MATGMGLNMRRLSSHSAPGWARGGEGEAQCAPFGSVQRVGPPGQAMHVACRVPRLQEREGPAPLQCRGDEGAIVQHGGAIGPDDQHPMRPACFAQGECGACEQGERRDDRGLRHLGSERTERGQHADEEQARHDPSRRSPRDAGTGRRSASSSHGRRHGRWHPEGASKRRALRGRGLSENPAMYDPR